VVGDWWLVGRAWFMGLACGVRGGLGRPVGVGVVVGDWWLVDRAWFVALACGVRGEFGRRAGVGAVGFVVAVGVGLGCSAGVSIGG
jgi:hypothetical protein